MLMVSTWRLLQLQSKETRPPLKLAVYLDSVVHMVLVMQTRKMNESGDHGDIYQDS